MPYFYNGFARKMRLGIFGQCIMGDLGVSVTKEESWKELNKAWQDALAAVMEVESIIHAQVKLHFEKGGPGPTKALQDWLLELRQDENEARGRLDHFIHEHFG